ncbi:UNVERIFIED_CONTAM: hypothetical protein Scaly_1182000 [Sesamum calycinum]|uniref:Chorein N-terminal domain-containing protein n=1 Tax=Sesamum calycinum TaxID=2727403 RepID=A0AAW2Q3G6_9LAMI
MESILARALEYTLKYWLKSFTRDQFKLQGRTVQLSNLDINGDALHASVGLPPALNVTTAKVGKLEIVLPSVSNVQVEPIVVQVDRLDLVLEENDDVDPSSNSSSTASVQRVVGADKIADGMTLQIQTVNLLLETHGRAQQGGGATWASPMASITMRNLVLYTTNESWKASVSDGENAKYLTRVMVGGLFLRDTFSRPPCTLIQPSMQDVAVDFSHIPDFGSESFDRIFTPENLSRRSSASTLGLSPSSNVALGNWSPGMESTLASLEEAVLDSKTKCAALAKLSCSESSAEYIDSVKQLSLETTVSAEKFPIEKRRRSEIIRDRKSRTGLVKPEPPNFEIGWKRTKPIPMEKPTGYVIMDFLEKLVELMEREFGSVALLATAGEIVAERAREEAEVLRDEGKVEERMVTELCRVLKLMEMDLAMVKAAVKEETLNERLEQAKARCRQAILVANSF